MNPPRPRHHGNKDLPANLYADTKNGATYYRFKHPLTGKRTGFGTDKQKAVEAANILNAKFLNDATLTDRITGNKSLTVNDAIMNNMSCYAITKRAP